MNKEFKCDICGKTFKSESGLLGHKRLSHSEQRIKSTPDNITKRMEALESRIASTTEVKTEDSVEGVIKALEVLCPLADKYNLVLGPWHGEKRKDLGFWSIRNEWTVKEVKDYELSSVQGGF